MNPNLERAVGVGTLLAVLGLIQVILVMGLRLIQTIFVTGVFVPWLIYLPFALILGVGITEAIYRIKHRKDDASNLLGLAPNVICAVCGHKNPPKSRSCGGCGVRFTRYVPLSQNDLKKMGVSKT
jgi:hypothetical protein